MLNGSGAIGSGRSLEQISEAMRYCLAELLQIQADFQEDDNLFELGFHSLLAVKLIEWVRQTLYAELGVRELYTTPTLRNLAKVVHQHQAARHG